MKKTTIFASILIALVLLPVSVATQTPEAKRKLINELIEVTGVLNAVEGQFRKGMEDQKRLMESMFDGDMYPPSSSSMSEAEKKELQKKAISDMNRIVDRMTDRIEKEIDFKEFSERSLFKIYDKHYTESDLRELIVFYQTPIGKKVLAAAPSIEAETMKEFEVEMLPRFMKIIKEVSDIEMKELMERLEKEFPVDDESDPDNPSSRN